MNKTFTTIAILICIGIMKINQLNAQVFRKVKPVICPIDPVSHDTYVAPPALFLKKMQGRARDEEAKGAAEIIVTYNGFTSEAQTAFQFAVDIWTSLLDSPVPIYVNASFSDLGAGTLGSAGPTSFVRSFDGAPIANTFYPLPLAEKLAAKTLNADGEADINASFSSTFGFYFGTDGNPPAEEIDFVSVVLHELGHGLGFSGFVSFDEETGEGTWDISTNAPSIYTNYVELGDGSSITSLPTSGIEVGDALTSDDLFFNALLSITTLGETPKLFAPTTWDQGSSYSHLDETTYPAGNENSLMSPQIGSGEAIHDPGVTLDMFADMGWVHTYLTHVSNNELTDNVVDPFTVDLSITSDTTINLLVPIVTYTYSDFNNSIDLAMIDSGDGITFSAEIPNPGMAGTIKYFFSGVQDGLGRNYTSPGTTPDNFHQIIINSSGIKSLPYLATDGGSFEVNQTDFQSVSLSGGEALWELGAPTNTLDQAISGVNVWKTKLDTNIPIPSTNTIAALISPSFDFSDDTKNHTLSFSYSMENAFNTAVGLFETGPFGFHIQYTTDEGQNWNLLGEKNDQAGTNWYNIEETSPTVFPADANAGWIKQTIEITGTDTVFIAENVSFNVSQLTGNSSVNFRITFYVSPDFIEEGYEADGVLIDDFEILKSSPTADFKSTTSGILFGGSEVQFEYLSTGASTYLWNFGDGGTSDVANPTHVYAQGGNFDVTLTITSPDGTATLTKPNFISIVPQRTVPYLAADGGDLEADDLDFVVLNISGTGFDLGSSAIAGKSGTASGSNAFVTGINSAQYVDNSEAFIFTPEFDLSSLVSYELSFKAKYSFESGWDGFIVEYTFDRGLNWSQLDSVVREGWYDVIGEDNPDQGWAAIPLFTGSTNDAFETKSADVSFLGGEETVAFRIRYLSDAAEVDIGMAIDDFELLGEASGAASPDFIIEGNTGCSGHEVIFTNISTGTIESLSWDFGAGATPATAEGIGPHMIIFESTTAVTNNVTLTATSSVNGTVQIEKSFTTAPVFEVEPFTITFAGGETLLIAPEGGDGYQWYAGGVSIDGATSQELIITEFGQNYSVEVFIDGCSAISSEQIVVSGVEEELREFGVNVFPNPVKSILNIDIDHQIQNYLSIRIFNYNGKRIFNQTLNSSVSSYQKQFDLSDQKAGIYHIEIVIDGNLLSKKILIE